MNYEFGFWIILGAFLILFVVMCYVEQSAYYRGYHAAMDRAIAEAESVMAEKMKRHQNF